MLIRTGRVKWIFGEILFSLMSAVTYVGAIFVGITGYTLISNGYIGNYWSDYTLKFYYEHSEEYIKNANLFMTTSTYTQGKPFEIILTTLALLALYIFIMILILLAFQLSGHKILGLISVIGLTFIGLTFIGLPADATNSVLRWIFPVTHISFGWHFNDFYAKSFCSLETSFLYFGILLILFLVLDIFLVKKAMLGGYNDDE
jgi:hypothetical protein